jgi:hypothetical protein
MLKKVAYGGGAGNFGRHPAAKSCAPNQKPCRSRQSSRLF